MFVCELCGAETETPYWFALHDDATNPSQACCLCRGCAVAVDRAYDEYYAEYIADCAVFTDNFEDPGEIPF